jgi:GNAT superfamily N-acetyltransferase
MNQTDLFQIEVAGLNAWPAPRQMFYDGWSLRFTGGHSKRVNSVNPLYSSTLPFAEKIAFCEMVFARQGQPCLFRIGDFIDQSALKGALEATGYTPFDPTFVLGRALALDDAPHSEVTILEMPMADWFRMRAQFVNVSPVDQQAHEAILNSIVPEKVLLGLFAGGQPVACGMGVVEGLLMGFFSIYTAAHRRRKGYAEMIMSALTDWGLQHDATYGYLQVEGHNRPALKLYQKLGYEQCYSYVYYERARSEW